MNIHEYQAKELLRQYKVTTPNGRVAASAEDARQIKDAVKSLRRNEDPFLARIAEHAALPIHRVGEPLSNRTLETRLGGRVPASIFRRCRTGSRADPNSRGARLCHHARGIRVRSFRDIACTRVWVDAIDCPDGSADRQEKQFPC